MTTLRQPREQAVLSGEEIATVRQVLVDCARLLVVALEHTDPPAGALLARVTDAATAGRHSPDGLIYFINVAIDSLDFAPAARRRR